MTTTNVDGPRRGSSEQLTRVLRSAVPRIGGIPLYMQIRDSLVEAIDSGALAEGDRLPSEGELAAAFRVGRPTARQALGVLRREGRIVTRRGAGTFVARSHPSISLLGFDGLTRMLEARGLATADEILSTTVDAALPLQILDPEVGDAQWFLASRLRRLAQGAVPICIEHDAFNLDRCPEAPEIFASTQSATSVLEEGYGFRIASCDVATQAVSAGASDASLLDVRRSTPLLRMERVNRILDGDVVHAAVFLVCTDRVPVVETVVNTSGPA